MPKPRGAAKLSGAFAGLPAALRRLRGERGQAEIAERGGIKPQQISRYENGHEVPQLDQLEKVLRGLGSDAHDLAHALDEVAGRAPRSQRPDDSTPRAAGVSLPAVPIEAFREVEEWAAAMRRAGVQPVAESNDSSAEEAEAEKAIADLEAGKESRRHREAG
jgi:transcriptional regulator with XRE-family HTH domain